MEASLFEEWIENDYNPFLLFGEDGKIIFINKEAQFLLGETNQKELFSIAKTYASYSYGFKTTHIELDFGRFGFFALTVGYLDDQKIGLKLYKRENKLIFTPASKIELTNIYTILDLCQSAFLATKKIRFERVFDPAFPELMLNIEGFVKILNKIYESFTSSEQISTKLFLKTGEYIKLDNKRYPIFTVSVFGQQRDENIDRSIEKIAHSINCLIHFKKDNISLDSPMITEGK